MLENLIFILFACDEWKSWSSMRLVMATGDVKILKNMIGFEIANKNMTLDNQEAAFELAAEEIGEINNQLTYGFVQIVRDGEQQ